MNSFNPNAWQADKGKASNDWREPLNVLVAFIEDARDRFNGLIGAFEYFIEHEPDLARQLGEEIYNQAWDAFSQ